jgi:hypothetical protein
MQGSVFNQYTVQELRDMAQSCPALRRTIHHEIENRTGQIEL